MTWKPVNTGSRTEWHLCAMTSAPGKRVEGRQWRPAGMEKIRQHASSSLQRFTTVHRGDDKRQGLPK